MSDATATVHFRRPPIQQVRFTFFFEGAIGLRTHHLGGLLDRWREIYPQVIELEPLPALTSRGTQSEPEDVEDDTWPLPLYEFANAASGSSLLLQGDRLAVLWDLDVESGKPYPGFEQLRLEVLTRLAELVSRLEDVGLSDVVVSHVESRYLNEINGMHAGEYLAATISTPDAPQTLGNILTPADGMSFTRHVHEGSNVDTSLWFTVQSNDSAGMTMTITARRDDNLRDPAATLDACHDAALNCFLTSTLPSMQHAWDEVK